MRPFHQRHLGHVVAGVLAAGLTIGAFTPLASATTDSMVASHTNAAKWCASIATLNSSPNTKAQAIAIAKTFRRLGSKAPTAALRRNMQSFGSRLQAAAAHYPHPPRDAASLTKLARKIASELGPVCAAAGSSSSG